MSSSDSDSDVPTKAVAAKKGAKAAPPAKKVAEKRKAESDSGSEDEQASPAAAEEEEVRTYNTYEHSATQYTSHSSLHIRSTVFHTAGGAARRDLAAAVGKSFSVAHCADAAHIPLRK